MKQKKILKGYEKVTDYGYLKQGKKYWSVMLGNPLCMTEFRVSLIVGKEKIVKDIKKMQMAEKRRFVKKFHNVEWESEDADDKDYIKIKKRK